MPLSMPQIAENFGYVKGIINLCHYLISRCPFTVQHKNTGIVEMPRPHWQALPGLQGPNSAHPRNSLGVPAQIPPFAEAQFPRHAPAIGENCLQRHALNAILQNWVPATPRSSRNPTLWDNR